MMQLLCDGVYLDLTIDSKMTLQKENPLFAFDKIKCERTTEFSLPATPKNNKVFGIAKDPALYGIGMRRRFEAQMVNGVCVKDGFLYLSKYNEGNYTAIFVTGDFYGLQRVKSAGKLADIVNHAETMKWQASNEVNANTATARDGIFEMVKYKSTFGGVPYPSTLAKAVATKCATALGVTINGWPASMDYVRMIPPSLKGFERVSTDISSVQGITDIGDNVQINTSTSSRETIIQPTYLLYRPARYIVEEEAPYGKYWAWFGEGQSNDRIAGWVAMTDIDIRIDDSLPDTYFMVTELFPSYPRVWENYQVANFLGGYFFTPEGGVNGQPLRGRVVRVPAGTPFAFINIDDYRTKNASDYAVGSIREAHWFATNNDVYTSVGQPSYSLHIQVSQYGDIVAGSDIYMLSCLPDITLIDLLKCIAAMSGTALNYSESQGISFDAVDVDSWREMGVKEVTKVGAVERKFADYGQMNYVRFASGESVFGGEVLETTYLIDNDNLKEDNVLMEIPFSEASIDYENGAMIAFIRDNEDGKTDKWCMMNANTDGGPTNMSRVALYRNDGIDLLCGASTQLTIRCRMTQYNFESMSAETKILFRGTLYVWTSAKWSDDSAEITLAKI